MSRWFRFYDDALNDPKVQKLDGETFKHWVNILCLASKLDGTFSVDDVAWHLRTTSEAALRLLLGMADATLMDRVNATHWAPHNWKKHQYKSDTSTDRVKRFRKRSETVSETPPDTETDTETDNKKGARSALAFEGSVIRLNEQDFTRWRVAYGYLDLRAELQTRDDWLAREADEKTRKNWFIPTSNYLANRNAKAKADRDSGYSAVMPC